ncbi:hypothetical protein [Amedibacillus sp. YH-ame10]
MKLNVLLPSKETAKGKSITVICMVLIVLSLYSVSYFLFMRTIDVDVTKDASITYRGETGTASVKVENKMKAYNQRIQEFMNSITYEVTPQSEIYNDAELTITASYDKELARVYNIHPINTIRKVKVKDLPVRFAGADEIPKSLFKEIASYGDTYLKNNIKSILEEDFTSFYVESQPKLENYTLTYRVFLDSFQGSVKDKIIDIYTVKAKGEVNTASEGEAVLEEAQETIYYMLTFNEINTSLNILDENVYGEKMIVNTSYNMSLEEDFQRYIRDKYAKLYNLTFLEIVKK